MIRDQPPRPANMLHIVAVNQGHRPCAETTPVPETLPPERVTALIDEGVALIDARGWAEFGVEHVAGSINIAESSSSFEQNIGWLLPSDDRFVLVVADMLQARRAAQRMAFVGLDSRLVGAMPLDTWRETGRPLGRLPQIDIGTLHAELGNGDGTEVIDVRAEDEWQAGRIDAARHCDFRQLPRLIDELGIPRDRRVAVICAGGLRSSIGASLLARAGWRDVVNVRGGMNAWTRAGLPTVGHGSGG